MLSFHKGRQMEKGDSLNRGNINICHPLQQFHIPSLTPAKLSSLTSLKAWGEKQRVCHNIAFLLVLAEEEATGEGNMVYQPSRVNPGQARVHSMEEGSWESDCLDLKWTQLALHLGAVT